MPTYFHSLAPSLPPHPGESGQLETTGVHGSHKTVGQHAVEGPQHLVVANHQGDVRAQCLQDACQLHGNVATPHYHHLPGGRRDGQGEGVGLVKRDGLISVRVRHYAVR